MNQRPTGAKIRLDRFLDVVERGGNALPHPAMLFAMLALLVVVLSWLAAQISSSAQHPSTGATVTIVSLLSLEGLHRSLTDIVGNFFFAPLGPDSPRAYPAVEDR